MHLYVTKHRSRPRRLQGPGSTAVGAESPSRQGCRVQRAGSKRGEPTCCPEPTFAGCRPHNLCVQEASAVSKCSVVHGEAPPPQYSGLPRRPVRVRKFRFNDFTTKFNRQWTPSKTPAPRRKEALNGKGGRTGSQPHATEAPLRGCHPQAGGRLLSTVPHAHHCADNLVFTLTSGKLR